MGSEQYQDRLLELRGLLSEKVMPPQERLKQILSQERATGLQRVFYWFYRRHSILNATMAALLIFVGGIAIAAAIGHYQQPVLDQVASDYVNEIQSLAQIMGGIYAILLAVITFSVQTHAQRDEEGAFLANYLHQKHGSYWVSAVAAGATLVNVFAPVARSFGLPISFPAILVADVLLVPTVILWSLWLLHVTTRDASLRVDDVISDPSDFRFEAFRRDIASAVAVDQFQADFIAQFQRLIEKTRLSYNPYAAHFSSGNNQRERFEFSVAGGKFIADVDLRALRGLVNTLGSLPEEWTINITIGPFSRTTARPLLVIVGDAPPTNPVTEPRTSNQIDTRGISNIPSPPAKLTDAQQRKIRHLLPQVFVAGKPPPDPRNLNDFFQRFGQRLLSATTDGSSVKLKQSLEGLTNFVRFWCTLGKDTNPGSDPWVMNSSSAFVGPLAVQLYEVIRNALDSGDVDKVEAVLNFLVSVATIAFGSLHSRLFIAATRYIPYCYYQGLRRRRIAKDIGRLIDEELHSFLWHFEARRMGALDQESNALINAQQPLLDQALSVCLRLVRSAMERGRVQDAKNYLDRIYEHKRYDHPAAHFDPAPPSGDLPVELDDFVLVVAIGWALDLLENSKKANVKKTAQEVIKQAAERLPKRHRLVWLWEKFEDPPHGSLLRQRLGINDWDPRDRDQKMRRGVSYSRVGDHPWLSRGFYFALLAAPVPLLSEMRNFFTSVPSTHFWEVERIKPLLTSIVAQHWAARPTGDQAKLVESVVALIAPRELAARLKQIKETAVQQIDPAILEQMREKIIEVWRTNRSFAREVLKSADSHVQIRPFGTALPDWTYFLPRAAVVRSVTVIGLEQEVGRAIALRQNISEFHLAELAVKQVRPSGRENLSSQIAEEVTRLRSLGYKPDLVLLPESDDFVEMLFGKPAHEVEFAHALGRFFVGEWNGLKVARWPYTDAASILVADISRLFSTSGALETPPVIEIKTEDPAATAETVAKAESATSVREMPNVMDIRFQMTVHAMAFYCVADENAATKIVFQGPDK